MTLETRKKRLEIAKKHNNPKEIAFWTERVSRHPDYKPEPKEEPKPKEVKKRVKTKKR